MAQSVFYVQACPTCGRSLEVRVDYLGKTVSCEHCRASFIATQQQTDPLEDSVNGMLQKADEFLRTSTSRRPVY